MTHNSSRFVQLPEPCLVSEDFFSKTSDGKFCSKCQELVVDFTRMTKEEVHSFLKCNAEVKCGTFNEDQLIREEEVDDEVHNSRLFGSWFGVKYLVILLLLFSSVKSNSFVYESVVGYEIVSESSPEKPVDPARSAVKIKGRLLKNNHKQSGLRNVKVVDSSTGNWTVTDRQGFFEIEILLNDSETTVLQFLDKKGESWDRRIYLEETSDVIIFYKEARRLGGKFMIADYE